MATQNVGRVVRVIGPVVDVEFEKGDSAHLQRGAILDASGEVPIRRDRGDRAAPGETGCAASRWLPTDGMVRGIAGDRHGGRSRFPWGGDARTRAERASALPVDENGPRPHAEALPHPSPGAILEEQSTKLEIFETGIR